MHIKETFSEKATEGTNRVLEFGVYILETLGSVGLPAEQVTAVLLSLKKPFSAEERAADKGTIKKRKRQRKSGLSKNRQLPHKNAEASLAVSNTRDQKSNDLFHRALRFVIEAKSSSPQQVISRILFYLADALGETLDRPSQRDLERAVGAFVEEAHVQRGNRVRLERIPQPLCRAVTGVVLSYQEREDISLPAHTVNKIRRGMHFDIPIRPFDATVQLLPAPHSRLGSAGFHQLRITSGPCDPTEVPSDLQLLDDGDEFYDCDFAKLYQQDLEEQDLMGRMMVRSRNESHVVVPCTPSSFPPTPESRTQLLGDYSEFTENVLYRARDELRGEQEDNDRPRMAIFNPEDAHPKILLSCGGHCASLEPRGQQSRIYTSVRTALSFQYGRSTYYEICPVWNGARGELGEDNPLQLCVGLSTKAMPLRNTVAGCSPKTLGLDSSGVMLFSGRRTRSTGFTYGSVIGVCVRAWISHIRVAFFVDGEPVSCDALDLGINPSDVEDDTTENGSNNSSRKLGLTKVDNQPPRVSEFTIRNENAAQPYFPTISIKSNKVKVNGHFSAADMHQPDADNPYWARIAQFSPGEPLFALDGTRLLVQHVTPPSEIASPISTELAMVASC